MTEEQRPPGIGEQRTERELIPFRDELSEFVILDHLGSNPSVRLWVAMRDLWEYSQIYYDAASQETVWKIKNAFYALAFSQMIPRNWEGIPVPDEALPDAELYKKLKQEQIERGEDVPWIDLTSAQGQDLRYVLDLAGVPFTGKVDAEGNVRVSLAPLEQQAQYIVGLRFAQRREFQKPYTQPENPLGKLINLKTERTRRRKKR